MNVFVNGATRDVAEGTTVADLLTGAGAPMRGSAVVVDDEVVPRSSWPQWRLREGQRVELITAVPGG